MQQFNNTPQQYPDTRDAAQRKQDFDEISQRFTAGNATNQAERCLQCGVPFCQVHCPLHNHIPDWLRYTSEGRLRDAYDLAASTNNFPEICGRICPQDRLCEGNCVVEADFGAITIGSIEKYITDTAWDEGWVQPFTPSKELGISAGIIGTGPAGLAAAQQLRAQGVDVHMYDRHDRAGGLLTYGIPNFKLDKSVVMRRIKQYEDSGIHFHLGVSIGDDITIKTLQEKHDSVLIATGVYQARELDLARHERYSNIHPALDFLTESNRIGFGDNAENNALNAKDRNVVVIGGGDTAMDCVRTAIRQQAQSVTCVYRRDRDNMPGSAREVQHAMDEGVTFQWLSTPAQFHGNDTIDAIDIQRMRLGAAAPDGRRFPEAIPGKIEQHRVDLVIKALGFTAEDLPTMFNAPDLTLNRHGTVKIDSSMMTALDGVFAAGDIVRGASLVVWAIADGRDAARHMMQHMMSARDVAGTNNSTIQAA